MTDSNVGTLLSDGDIRVDDDGVGWIKIADVREAYDLDVVGKRKPYSSAAAYTRQSVLEDVQRHSRAYAQSAREFREQRDDYKQKWEHAQGELAMLLSAKYVSHKHMGEERVFGPSKEEHLSTIRAYQTLLRGVINLADAFERGDLDPRNDAVPCLRTLADSRQGESFLDVVGRMERGIDSPLYKASDLLADLKRLRVMADKWPKEKST